MTFFHWSEENENAFSKGSSPALRMAHQQFYLEVLHFIYLFTEHFLGAFSEPDAIIDIS